MPSGTAQLLAPTPLFAVLQLGFATEELGLSYLVGVVTKMLVGAGEVPLTRSVFIYPRLATSTTSVVFALSREDAEERAAREAFADAPGRLNALGFRVAFLELDW